MRYLLLVCNDETQEIDERESARRYDAYTACELEMRSRGVLVGRERKQSPRTFLSAHGAWPEAVKRRARKLAEDHECGGPGSGFRKGISRGHPHGMVISLARIFRKRKAGKRA